VSFRMILQEDLILHYPENHPSQKDWRCNKQTDGRTDRYERTKGRKEQTKEQTNKQTTKEIKKNRKGNYRVHLEMLVKKFHSFYGNRSYIAVLKRSTALTYIYINLYKNNDLFLLVLQTSGFLFCWKYLSRFGQCRNGREAIKFKVKNAPLYLIHGLYIRSKNFP
jgi:hypothetical protein